MQHGSFQSVKHILLDWLLIKQSYIVVAGEGWCHFNYNHSIMCCVWYVTLYSTSSSNVWNVKLYFLKIQLLSNALWLANWNLNQYLHLKWSLGQVTEMSLNLTKNTNTSRSHVLTFYLCLSSVNITLQNSSLVDIVYYFLHFQLIPSNTTSSEMNPLFNQPRNIILSFS